MSPYLTLVLCELYGQNLACVFQFFSPLSFNMELRYPSSKCIISEKNIRSFGKENLHRYYLCLLGVHLECNWLSLCIIQYPINLFRIAPISTHLTNVTVYPRLLRYLNHLYSCNTILHFTAIKCANTVSNLDPLKKNNVFLSQPLLRAATEDIIKQ